MSEHKQRKLTESDKDCWRRVRLALDCLPPWTDFPEWHTILDLRNAAIDKIITGTSDGKPWVEPEPEPLVPTDDWLLKFIAKHGRRPKVMVRDREGDGWRDPAELLCIEGLTFRFRINGGWWRECQLAPGEPREVE